MVFNSDPLPPIDGFPFRSDLGALLARLVLILHYLELPRIFG